MSDVAKPVFPHVHSWYDPPLVEGEENSGEVIVERDGFIPAHVEIEELIAAGERLSLARGVYEFDADEEIPEGYHDPYRAPGADRVDLDRMVGTVAHQLKVEAARIEEEKKASEAAKAGKEGPSGDVPEKK